MASPIPNSGIFDSLPFGFAQGKFAGVVPLKERVALILALLKKKGDQPQGLIP
jgi:hypothetical protein